MKPRTTVVISNYNYDKYVGSAIDSCVAQDIPIKIIVVDDCSTDKSWSVILEKIKRYRKFPILAVRLDKNSGGNARGRNVGIKLCDTKYVACLDSDDMFTVDSVRSRQGVLDKNEKVGFVHSFAHILHSKRGYDYIIKNLKSNIFRTVPCYTNNKIRGHLKGVPFSDIGWFRGINRGTVLSRVDNYRDLGLYDEELRWKIDREMWWRFLYFGIKKDLVKQKLFIYRRHGRQVTKNRKVKNPKVVNKKFSKITKSKERDGINCHNTILFDEYDENIFIAEHECMNKDRFRRI